MGALKWFSWLSVVLLLSLAVPIDTTALFFSVSMSTYLVNGERRTVSTVVDNLGIGDRVRGALDEFASCTGLCQACTGQEQYATHTNVFVFTRQSSKRRTTPCTIVGTWSREQ